MTKTIEAVKDARRRGGLCKALVVEKTDAGWHVAVSLPREKHHVRITPRALSEDACVKFLAAADPATVAGLEADACAARF